MQHTLYALEKKAHFMESKSHGRRGSLLVDYQNDITINNRPRIVIFVVSKNSNLNTSFPERPLV